MAAYIVAHKGTQKIAHWLKRFFPDYMDNPKPLNAAECRSLLIQYEDKNAELAKLFTSEESMFSLAPLTGTEPR